MITITYSKGGVAVADCDAEKVAYNAWLDKRDLKVSTENVIMAIRCLIAEQSIPHGDVCFVFPTDEGEHILHPDKDSRLAFWPKGFCDYSEDWLTRMLGWKVRKYENKKGSK